FLQAFDFFKRLLQCGSRLVLFGDIDARADVLDNATGLVQDGMADRVKVLDRTVTKDDAVLGVELAVLLLRGLICGSDSGPVVRMNSGVHPVDVGQGLRRLDAAYSKHLWGYGVRGALSFQLFERPAEVLEDLAVDVFDLTAGCHDRDETGDGLDDQPKGFLSSPERLVVLHTLDSRPSLSP